MFLSSPCSMYYIHWSLSASQTLWLEGLSENKNFSEMKRRSFSVEAELWLAPVRYLKRVIPPRRPHLATIVHREWAAHYPGLTSSTCFWVWWGQSSNTSLPAFWLEIWKLFFSSNQVHMAGPELPLSLQGDLWVDGPLLLPPRAAPHWAACWSRTPLSPSLHFSLGHRSAQRPAHEFLFSSLQLFFFITEDIFPVLSLTLKVLLTIVLFWHYHVFLKL